MTETALLSPVQARRPLAARMYGDDRLARLASRGDVRAFAALYERHHQALSRYCRAILRDEDDAEEALQSAMTRAYAALLARERDLKVRPWLFRIAHNEAISILRRRPASAELSAHDEPAGPTLEQTVVEREGLATLLEDLRALPERQRAAVVLRELNGLSMEEIAGALSVSRGAAKQMLYEARCALHEFAEGRAMGCEHVRRAISDGDGRALRARRMRAHMRHCAGCRQFAGEIDARTATLQALVPPLPAAWATATLVKALAHGSAHAGTAASAGSGGALAGPLSSSLALKALAGTAAIGAAAAGTAHLVDRPATPARPPAQVSPAPAGGAAGAVGDARTSGRAGAPTVLAPAGQPAHKGRAETPAAQATPGEAHLRGFEAPGRGHGAGAAHVRGSSPGQAKRSGGTSAHTHAHQRVARAKVPSRPKSYPKATSGQPGSPALRPGHESQGASTGSRGESNTAAGEPRREAPGLLRADPTPVIP